MFGIVPFVGAGSDEQLRHLVVVQIALDRGIRRRAEDVERQQDLIFLNHLAHQFDGLRRTVAVVAADEVDLAAVDAALFIDGVEKGGLRLGNRAVGRSRAAIGIGVADLDLSVAGAGAVLASGERKTANENEAGRRKAFCEAMFDRRSFDCHEVLPLHSFRLLRPFRIKRLSAGSRDNLAKQLPSGAVEFLQLHLFDRLVITGAR